MRIAVLLTVHNRREKTLRALDLLYSCTLPEGMRLTCFLTDDGSTDGTAEAVSAAFPEVRIVPGDGNLFWCRGMLEAWKAARAEDPAWDAYLWLNDDTYLFPDALLQLVACRDRHPGAIVVGPACSAETGEFTYGGRGELFLHCPPEGVERKLVTFDGNVVWVPSAVVERYGLLDRRFSHGMGDSEYGLRVTRHGGEAWQTAGFVGTCESHERPADWSNPDVPLCKRWKALHSPFGCRPREYFLVDRHNGFFTAVRHYFLIYIRVLFPSWWKNSPY